MKQTCAIGTEELTAWIEGTLPAHQALRISSHVTDCEKCRNAEHGLRLLKEDLRRLPIPSISASFTANVLYEARRRKEKRFESTRRPWVWWFPSQVVAAAALVTIAITS